MFGDIGWAELMLIGIVALIVIGPEDLPDMFRQLGRFTAKLRQMSREFSRAMEQAAKESGVKDVADDLKAATSAKSLGLNKVKEAADRFEKWDPIKSATNGATPQKPTAPVNPVYAAVPVPEPTIHGAETQALIDKKAAKKAILAEATEKLKAVDAPKPAPKPRTKKAVPPVEKPALSADTPAPKPRKRQIKDGNAA